jgi:uncharacterized protein YbbC (DUF1343 family)
MRFSFFCIFGFFLCKGQVFASDKPLVPPQAQNIITGAERTSLYFPLLQGKRIGLTINHTSRVQEVPLLDTLLHSGYEVKRIFSPEHGYNGFMAAGTEMGNSTDNATGIPLISLYGTVKKPSPEDLQGIDIMIYDIQDEGVRCFTYISTMHYVMEACAENGIPLLILDRPNPNGHYIDGPVLDTLYKSFVGMDPIPVVYGMTAGELAQMINGEGWLSEKKTCRLQVVPCLNYHRNDHYQLPVNPSPNMNSMEAVYLYPSMVWFEGTIMSVGRGTPFPFRIAGHPLFPDRTFSFIPIANLGNPEPKFMNRTCYGIDLRGISGDSLQKMKSLNLQWLIDCYHRMERDDAFFTNFMDQLSGSMRLRQQIIAGYTEKQIRLSWKNDLDNFRMKRHKYLIYSDK